LASTAGFESASTEPLRMLSPSTFFSSYLISFSSDLISFSVILDSSLLLS